MTKKRKRTKARRSIYRYTCASCDKLRWAFVYERAKSKTCAKCEIVAFANEHQARLFETDTSESVRVSPGHAEGETDTHTGSVGQPPALDKA